MDHGRPGGRVDAAGLATLAGKRETHPDLGRDFALVVMRLDQANRRLAFVGLAEDQRLVESNDELVRRLRGKYGS